MLRLTPVVRNLIMINVLVFVGSFLAGYLTPPIDNSQCSGMFREPADIITYYFSLYNSHTDCFRPYQLFTYMFMHGGISHIFFNMLTLAFMGPILESYWGVKRFTIFYLITGVGAGIFNIFVDQVFHIGGFGTMVGASGAIYGLLTAFGMLFPNMEIQLLIPPIPIKAKYLVLLLGGLSFLMDRSGGTAHFAHLGGVVFGFFIITAWRKQDGN
jgi:membrane associated rhomboid family serine protease